jgi:uncharacterized membrane protein
MNASRLMHAAGRIAILVLAISVASAETPLAVGTRSADAVPNIGGDVGSGWNILSIPAAAFIPISSSTTWTYGGNGYVWAGGTVGSFWAPVFLPSGAGVGLIGLYAYDTDPANDIVARLRRFTGYGDRICLFPPLCPPDVPPATADVTLVTSTGSSGYIYRESAVLNPLHTVNNDTAYGGGAQYTIMVTPAALGSMLQFKGVDIWWKR